MTGGGAIWTIAASTAAGALVAAARANALDQALANTSDGPYRPDLWQNAPLVTLTVPGQSTTNNASSTAQSVGGIVPTDGTVFQVSAGTHPGTPDTVYVFDAVFRVEHQQRIEKTQHPIQTGANVSDHAFIMPARIVLEIGMSDAMDSFVPGQWTGNSSKSVNAYQTLKTIAKTRQPLQLSTRLDSYMNVLLLDVSAPDTVETKFGLRATAVFEETLTGTVSTQTVSARTDLTGATNLGTKQALPVPSSILQQNEVNKATTVPDAGVLSSNPTGS